MGDAQAHRVFPIPVARLPEHRLRFFVVVFGVETKVRVSLFGPFRSPAGQHAGHFADIVLGVGAAVGAEREQLHHLARVVLVRFVLVVVDPVEEHEHRRVGGDGEEQVVKPAERVFAEQVVLLEHQPLAVDLFVGVGEPVVPDERHLLYQLLVGANHAIEPPGVISAPFVFGAFTVDRVAFVVDRSGP
jgi:hypothetical protein